MKHVTKMHYANESWSVGVCGSKPLSTDNLTWQFGNVTCRSCLRNKIYLRDLDKQNAYKAITDYLGL
jgi:hypothetical protein